MRGFQCHYYHDEGLKKKNVNISCWNGLNSQTAQYIKFDFIYIDEFNDPVTQKIPAVANQTH